MLFRNMHRKYYTKESGGEGGGGGGAPAPTPTPAPAPAPAPENPDFAAFQQWQQFQQWQKTQQPAPAPTPTPTPAPSKFEEMKREEQQKKTAQEAENALRAQVKFDLEFDGIIKANEGLFNIDAAKMREGAQSLEGEELIQQLKVMAVRSFLDNEANHGYMLDADLQYMKEHVIGKADRAIDADAAWQALERSFNVATIKKSHADITGGKNSPGGVLPNLAAWVQRAKDRWNRATK